jgi:hypothetical protein
MANVPKFTVGVASTITLQLTEAEARALDGIFGYNVDHFLKVFYERMGEAYVKPHEAGVRSLHETIRTVLNGPLTAIDRARTAIHGARKNGNS